MVDRVRRRRDIKPPEGWSQISEQILGLNQQMRMAEAHNVEEGDTQEQLWNVMRWNWKRSRPVYEMYYKKKSISKGLYEWILKNGYADRELIELWRKPGYDRVCCAACVSKNTDHGGTCICRVPRHKRDPGIKCHNCGCPGCCSGDFSDSDDEEKPISDGKAYKRTEKLQC